MSELKQRITKDYTDAMSVIDRADPDRAEAIRRFLDYARQEAYDNAKFKYEFTGFGLIILAVSIVLYVGGDLAYDYFVVGELATCKTQLVGSADEHNRTVNSLNAKLLANELAFEALVAECKPAGSR